MTNHEHVEPDVGSAEAPSDKTTLLAVLEDLRRRGFDRDFSTSAGAQIRCESCGTETDATEFVIERLRRMEGASDPDDMLAVVATACPVCKVQGTLILGYGPMASAQDIDVSSAMQDGREGQVSPSATPGT